MQKYLILFLLLAMSSSAFCQQVGDKAWKSKMHALLADTLSLAPYVYSDVKFSDPKNFLTIQKDIKSLKQHVSGLKMHINDLKMHGAQGVDPSFLFIAEEFEDELTFAQGIFASDLKAKDHAQGYLKAALGKCMQCHNESRIGPQLDIKSFMSDVESLALYDQFVLLASTRQFDKALSLFEQLTDKDKVKKVDTFDLERATKVALTIAIRVKNDPAVAARVIDRAIQSSGGSASFKSDLVAWKASAALWKQEKPKALTTAPDRYQEALRIFKKAQAQQIDLDKYQNQDIQMLRASALLHETLAQFQPGTQRADAYLLLSQVYDGLPGFAIWDLAEQYSISCIYENPHTPIALKCFNKFNELTILGYTGSAGTRIPDDVLTTLARLRLLSAVSGPAEGVSKKP